MEQSERLSLWLAVHWLTVSDLPLQALIVEDLETQIEEGSSFSEGLRSLTANSRRAGDFGMEIAGSLLAPVLVELLKSFWSEYLKKLAEDAGGSAAELTIDEAKRWFKHNVAPNPASKPLKELLQSIDDLVAANRISAGDADRLKSHLANGKLA